MKMAIYCRVSTEDQAERKTIENQVEFAQKYCELHGLNIFDFYKDKGISGMIPLELCPEGRRLCQDAEEKKIDTILVYKLDRLGRNARIILNAIYELEKHGIKIRSMTETFDTAEPSGRFMLTILAGVSDLERENFLQGSWQGIERLARAGKWVGWVPPYGYKVINKELVINDTLIPGTNFSEADVVKLIFELCVSKKWSKY